MRYLLTGLLLWVAAATLVQAQQTVYRTVDESGAVSFSDTPPEGQQPVETVTLDVAPPADPEVYEENLQAMRDTTDRMAEDRRAREKHRAEMRELAARSAAAEPAPPQNLVDQYSTSWSGGYYGGHYYRPGRPPWRPGYRPPSPGHPIHRPPVRPVPSASQQNNSQLMRPILPRGQ
ncbi:DUF4124 domain-containing protein [Pseudohalioglobus sediminis]|uniref:DUF4124 domain-containing protein n=1 Tax=Pseudohalioglobus sediminis TaxID=2606449 RepID=A0A5B0X1G6_9GAMM|nr:DUF4124 domain-containing protein [Pseudohalioglobus sediminis]KAA1192488.1 DUF4124 domain-containing protein [Pseudohalioglobus sediminis]